MSNSYAMSPRVTLTPWLNVPQCARNQLDAIEINRETLLLADERITAMLQ